MSEVFLMYVIYIYCGNQYCTMCKYYKDLCMIDSDFTKRYEKFRRDFELNFTEGW